MLTPDQTLAKISDICQHPGSYHWTGRQMANVIQRVISESVPHELSDVDAPIPFRIAKYE